MIFATVGTQVPFDRMIRAVDDWARSRSFTGVVAQIGDGTYEPTFCRSVRFISPRECRDLIHEADVVVAHAGMGTILTALELGKAIIVVPRRADLHEQRNDHQIATAQRLGGMSLVRVAWDETQLAAMLDNASSLRAAARIGAAASDRLVSTLRRFLSGAAGGHAITPAEHRRQIARFSALIPPGSVPTQTQE